MLIFGVNFNLFYLLVIKKFKTVFKSTELWVYISIVLVSSLFVASNLTGIYSDAHEVIRHSFFQVTSIMTTTGFSTVDFNLWPEFSKSVLFILIFVGACAGSTAGGLKISRVLMLFKMIGRELKRLLHPRSVSTVKMEGKKVEENTLTSTGVYFIMYVLCMGVMFFGVSLFDSFDFQTSITAVVTCFNNTGPGFGELIGPMGNYSCFSSASKIILSIGMLLGRLEIYPVIIALMPSTWVKK
jgi:trk system potassium uptake protein TrkH